MASNTHSYPIYEQQHNRYGAHNLESDRTFEVGSDVANAESLDFPSWTDEELDRLLGISQAGVYSVNQNTDPSFADVPRYTNDANIVPQSHAFPMQQPMPINSLGSNPYDFWGTPCVESSVPFTRNVNIFNGPIVNTINTSYTVPYPNQSPGTFYPDGFSSNTENTFRSPPIQAQSQDQPFGPWNIPTPPSEPSSNSPTQSFDWQAQASHLQGSLPPEVPDHSLPSSYSSPLYDSGDTTGGYPTPRPTPQLLEQQPMASERIPTASPNLTCAASVHPSRAPKEENTEEPSSTAAKRKRPGKPSVQGPDDSPMRRDALPPGECVLKKKPRCRKRRPYGSVRGLKWKFSTLPVEEHISAGQTARGKGVMLTKRAGVLGAAVEMSAEDQSRIYGHVV